MHEYKCCSYRYYCRLKSLPIPYVILHNLMDVILLLILTFCVTANACFTTSSSSSSTVNNKTQIESDFLQFIQHCVLLELDYNVDYHFNRRQEVWYYLCSQNKTLSSYRMDICKVSRNLKDSLNQQQHVSSVITISKNLFLKEGGIEEEVNKSNSLKRLSHLSPLFLLLLLLICLLSHSY